MSVIDLKQDNYLNFWKATQCSIGFLVLSIASNSVENIQSQAFADDGYSLLGFFALAFLYLTLGLGCFFSTAVIDRIGVRTCMFLGCLGDTLYIVSCIPPALKGENPDSTSFFLSDGFIVAFSTIIAVIDGIGDAI